MIASLRRRWDRQAEARAERLLYADLNVIRQWSAAVLLNVDRRRNPDFQQMLANKPQARLP